MLAWHTVISHRRSLNDNRRFFGNNGRLFCSSNSRFFSCHNRGLFCSYNWWFFSSAYRCLLCNNRFCFYGRLFVCFSSSQGCLSVCLSFCCAVCLCFCQPVSFSFLRSFGPGLAVSLKLLLFLLCFFLA